MVISPVLIFYNVTNLSELLLKRPRLCLIIPGRGRRLNVCRPTTGHRQVTRVAGLWRQVSGSRRRVSVERSRRQGHGHGGWLL